MLAFLLRAFAFLLPIGASLGTSVLLTRLLPFPSSTTQLVLWYVAILVATSLVLVVVERLAKKALPLAVLLRVTTVFPDHAPLACPDRAELLRLREGRGRHATRRRCGSGTETGPGRPR